MASAGLYASLHLAPDRQPRQHPTTRFLQAGCPSCRPTNSVKALKANSDNQVPHKCVKTFLLKFVIYDIKVVMITNGSSRLAPFHLLSPYPKLHQFTKFSVHVACGHGWYAMQRWREYDVQCMLKQTDSPGQQWGWSLISTLCLRKTTQTWPAITLEMHQLMLMSEYAIKRWCTFSHLT